MTVNFQPDQAQQQVIAAQGGYHLVLVPPGCGKTQLLAERILRAQQQGVRPQDMLCLTFTNRAARGMLERLREQADMDSLQGIYVGNVHRYCSKFLTDNALIPAESSILDDNDAFSIMARLRDEDEHLYLRDFRRKKDYQTVILFSHFMNQLRHRHEREVRMHPESLTKDDIFALRTICRNERMDFTAERMLHIYEHADDYRTLSRSASYDVGARLPIDNLLRKMEQAFAFEQYKRRNHLIDFEDLLIETFNALRNDTGHEYHRYKWIQVDEVQDLNLMQLRIIDMLTGPEDFTLMYLGDEQQAIFSFMGAKMSTLEMLKGRCDRHVHRLYTNHRAPKYLLEVLNEYATQQLQIDAALLPQASNDIRMEGGELTLLSGTTYESELPVVAHQVARWYSQSQAETTAVVVSSNADADMVSEALDEILVQHFKVSGEDLFSTAPVKLLLAHFNVLGNEHNFMGWVHLLHGLKVYETAEPCRRLVREMKDCSITPTDFLLYPVLTTYVKEFARAYAEEELVVFDTETTGLDMLQDDIVQIAAVKMRQGRVVEGSELNLYIRTEREIPAMLGDVVNPVLEEMKQHELLSHEEALGLFMDYVGNDVLVGHNIGFDYEILRHNLQRYLPEVSLTQRCAVYFDSLKLAHLLEPDLAEYKLRYLLAALGLEGSNSHLADEDVNATCSLLRHCYAKALQAIPLQDAFLASQRNMSRLTKFQQAYKTMYLHTHARLREVQTPGQPALLLQEMQTVYEMLLRGAHIEEVEKMEYIFNYLRHELLCGEIPATLGGQLRAYMMEMNTLKESDLCNSQSMPARVFVSTVHKAKGLEFDNVVVFDAVDGRYPNHFTRNDAQAVAEDARKFYVAMSRAKRRLCISYCQTVRRYDKVLPRELTPFMQGILRYFTA